jgi:outer membrane protein assembly factor BamA
MVIIDSIHIEGNKKTKNRILLRELTFSQGDSIPFSTLSAVIEQNRLRLMNTNLFLNAKMNVKKWESDNHVSIQISVNEKWFIYPIPIFEIADRNFNVWWKENKRDLSRTNLGMRFTYHNATGLRDPISALVQFGYTPKYSFSYSQPFVNKKQTIGLSVNYYNAVNREVGYSTDSNKVAFIRAEESLQRREATSIGFNYTPGLFIQIELVGFYLLKIFSIALYLNVFF